MLCIFSLRFPKEIEKDIFSSCGTEYISTKDKNGKAIDEVETEIDSPPNIGDAVDFNTCYQGYHWHLEGKITEKILSIIEKDFFKEDQSEIVFYHYFINIEEAYQTNEI